MLQVMEGVIKDLSPNKENLLRAASLGYSTATDLADWLTQELKFRLRVALYYWKDCESCF